MNQNKKVGCFHFFLFFLVFFIPPTFSQSLDNRYSANPITQDEALFVRRILEFWRDKEEAIVKSQIRQFIHMYPNSEYVDSLLVILGDMQWNEQNYLEALRTYNQIKTSHFRNKVFNNRLDSLYQLGRYEDLREELRGKVNGLQMSSLNMEQALWAYYYAEALLHLAKSGEDQDEAVPQYEEAGRHFSLLMNSEHRLNAELALSEIAMVLKKYPEAVEHYLNAAELMPEKREEMTMHAAQIQSMYSPEEAIQLYADLQNQEGELSSKAFLKKVALLFELGQHQQILEEERAFRQQLEPLEISVLNFYSGRSHYALNHHQEAIENLLPLLQAENKLPHYDDTMEKGLLLILGASAHQVNDTNLIHALAKQYEESYPDDPGLGKLLYLQAMEFKNLRQHSEALEKMEQVAQSFPDFERKENVNFERASLLYQLGRWKESRAAFKSFLEQYSDSSLNHSAVQYLACATQQELEEAEKAGLLAEN